MRQPTRLIRDGADRYKLKVSLPGGRYQLSLDDQAVIVLTDELGLDVRDTVPNSFVPFFVAVGDAWFPKQRDTDTIIEDLPTGEALESDERAILVSYLTGTQIPARNEERVLTAIENSPISGEVDASDLQINPLPSMPDILGESDSSGSPSGQSVTSTETEPSQKETQTSEIEPAEPAASSEPAKDAVKSLQQIPGIGPHRAEKLVNGGVQSLQMLADARPVELSEIQGISEGVATVAVEGAREIQGDTVPANQRLKTQTGVTEDVFDPALASLAGSGVPASEAMPTLRVLYGPTVADVDAVSGEQAYFLWEAGYQTPHDLIEASIDELIDVYQVGATTAEDIQASAHKLLDSNYE